MELDIQHKQMAIVVYRLNQLAELGWITEPPIQVTPKGFDIIHELDKENIPLDMEAVMGCLGAIGGLSKTDTIAMATLVLELHTIGIEKLKTNFEQFKIDNPDLLDDE